jgi:hypothetical protein
MQQAAPSRTEAARILVEQGDHQAVLDASESSE